MEAQRDVLIALFGAFAGFSAFGAAIATFLVSSKALPWLGAFWGVHGLQEAREARRVVGFLTRNRRGILLWAVGGGIGLATLVSCMGLVISYFWLDASTAADAVGGGWAYHGAGVLLVIEVVLITAITLVLALSAALYEVKEGPRTMEIYRQRFGDHPEHEEATDTTEPGRGSGTAGAVPARAPVDDLGSSQQALLRLICRRVAAETLAGARPDVGAMIRGVGVTGLSDWL